nr:EOG090X07IA [Chydorus sphaericus]
MPRLCAGKLLPLRRRLLASPLRYLILFAVYMGVFTHLAERDYYTEFSYPLNIDVLPLVRSLRSGIKDGPRILFVIKSALPHFDRRMAIRQTWGFERRFSDVVIRTVFLLGTATDNHLIQSKINEEAEKFGDIVQADFLDSYYNNTLKTMSGLKWAVENCPNASFVVFSDDDMYISTKNLLQFVRNPSSYPLIKEANSYLPQNPEHRERSLKQQIPEDDSRISSAGSDEELDDDFRLYAGYVFHSPPLRHRSSKWYVSLSEYPFHLWPPYVTAGAYVLSRSALYDLHYGSSYTQYFRFDDVFLGLVARKARIDPIHCPEFYFWKKPYSNPQSYRHVIASHGYHEPAELVKIWSQQKSLGFA